MTASTQPQRKDIPMEQKPQPVLVTTELRGVFFGYIAPGQDLTGKTIRLERARMCIYWSADVRGVLGLASTGPSNGCRISPPVPAITLQQVSSVAELSPEATERWESAPWSK